jgi:group II intron reverse transcriptase/maturase
MQSIHKLVEVLSDRGRRGLCLERVYRHLSREDLLVEAYAKIGKNDGALTRGIDGETVDGMSREKVQAISQLLRDGDWIWRPVRRIHIPKKNGKTRPLGIPTWSDKLVQQVIKFILEAYYEPQFSRFSFGFRSGLGCHHALKEIMDHWHAVKWFIEGDISKCFDSIDHGVLLAMLAEKIHDDRFLKLVRTMLEAGYLEDWRYGETLSGTPQGGIASPILANVYLDSLDKFVEATLLPRYNRGSKHRVNKEWERLNNRINHHRSTLTAEEYLGLVRERRGLPSRDTHDPNFRRLHYVRYADDFLLGFAGPKSEAEEIKAQIRGFLAERLRLSLSEEKTLITHATTEKARFLGYELGSMRSDTKVAPSKGGGLRRSVNGLIGLYVPKEAIESRCKAYMAGGRPTQRTNLLHASDFQIVTRYQGVFRGLVNYYAMAHNASKRLGRLRWVLETSLVHTLAGKHRCSAASLWRKHKVKVPTEHGHVNAFRMLFPRDGRPPLIAQFGGLSLRRREFTTAEDKGMGMVFAKSTDLIQRIAAQECQVCGATGVPIQVHHIKRLADLNKGGRRKMARWKEVMIGLRRKTIAVCVACHWDIHSGRYDGPALS